MGEKVVVVEDDGLRMVVGWSGRFRDEEIRGLM